MLGPHFCGHYVVLVSWQNILQCTEGEDNYCCLQPWTVKIQSGYWRSTQKLIKEQHILQENFTYRTLQKVSRPLHSCIYLSSVQYNTYRVVFIHVYVLVDVRNQMFLSWCNNLWKGSPWTFVNSYEAIAYYP